ncbi:MAG TPA: single-stranded DNA-binding protein [Mycobacteriales bacterium]
MNETTVTVIGNLVDDPKLRTTDSGHDLAAFRVASTARRPDSQTGRYADAGSLFLSVTCWRALAGNVTASLRKGDPVIVTGRLTTRTYEKDGQKRSVCEIEALAVGPDLARGTAAFRRMPRGTAPETRAAAEPAPGPEHLPEPVPDLVGAG